MNKIKQEPLPQIMSTLMQEEDVRITSKALYSSKVSRFIHLVIDFYSKINFYFTITIHLHYLYKVDLHMLI